MVKKVRTRFAPSPTGLMHLGGARTALFNYLFAQHHHGEFIVRFEDTDQLRNVQDASEQLLQDLRWLGIKVDATIGSNDRFGPYLQSQRLTLYQKYAQKLLDAKKAYYCFCTKAELTKERNCQLQSGQKTPRYNQKCWNLSSAEIANLRAKNVAFCIRFHVVSQPPVCFDDLVYGKMTFQSAHIEDFVLIKEDGFPTYNFAVVVDDHLMAITHVLRGCDHLSNTGKQLLLYRALSWEAPVFAHLSLIQFSAQTKMSKRVLLLEQNIDYYRQEGYLPEALFNYLALLGWTPDKFQELYTPAELIKRFNGQNLNKSRSSFSLVKLNWISKKKMMQLSPKNFLSHMHHFLSQKCLEWQKSTNKQLLLKVAFLQDQTKMQHLVTFFHNELSHFAQLLSIIAKHFLWGQTPQWSETDLTFLRLHYQLFDALGKKITTLSWTPDHIHHMLQNLQKETNIWGRNFYALLYLLNSGLKEGPKMDQFLFFWGKKAILRHIQQVFPNWTV